MTGLRSKKFIDRLPFRVRKWFTPVELPEYFIPPKLAQCLLATTPGLVEDILADEGATAGVVSGNGFWYLPDKTGQERPLLVAHVDTVCHRFQHPRHLMLEDEMLYNPDGILGADDRAGVYAAYMIRQATGVGVLLCDEEECGGKGARTAARVIGGLIQTHPYMIELDRQGHRQVVYYRDECEAFKRHFEAYGFAKNYGSFSDISILSRELDVPGANVSVGFHYQHSKDEWLDLRTLDDTIKRVTTLIEENKIIAFTPVVDKYVVRDWREFSNANRWYPPKPALPEPAPVVEGEFVPDVEMEEDLSILLGGEDLDTLSADELDLLTMEQCENLTEAQLDYLVALQVQRQEDERQEVIDDATLRDKEDNLYEWWNCG